MADMAPRHDLESVTGRPLAQAYVTGHGQLLCDVCVAHHGPQLRREGIAVDPCPCHGAVLCTLCDRPIGGHD